VDDEFNGGEVNVLGIEAMWAADVPVTGALALPIRTSYTLNHSEFQTGFSSDNPLWGTVEPGYEVPYMPRHQLAVQAGARGARWEIAAAGRWTSSMRDIAGSGEPAPQERIDDTLVFDLAGHVGFGRWGKLYATVDNLLDEATIVSRRPFGARPGKPRLAIIGYKNTF
jgi:Fe(3+) dicitrate transport protein